MLSVVASTRYLEKELERFLAFSLKTNYYTW